MDKAGAIENKHKAVIRLDLSNIEKSLF